MNWLKSRRLKAYHTVGSILERVSYKGESVQFYVGKSSQTSQYCLANSGTRPKARLHKVGDTNKVQSTVYIEKDQHLAVTQDWTHLSEMCKEENNGHTARMGFKQRKVTPDGWP